MKYLLVILLGLSFTCQAQEDSTVCIKPQTARYFLEADDERWVLREKDTLQTTLITNLKDQNLTKDKLIQVYKLDEVLYSDYIDNLSLENTLYIEENERLEKALKWRKRLELLVAIGTIIALIIL